MENTQVDGLEGYKLARKKSLAADIACMAIYRPAPGLKGITFEVWVLNRQVLNFCGQSIPPLGPDQGPPLRT